MTLGEEFSGLGKNQSEMFRGEFLQQLFQCFQTNRRLVRFVKQNDASGNDRPFDALNNSVGVIDSRVKGSSTPTDQLETARRQNRMKKGILETGWCTKPDWCGYADGRDCCFELVNFSRESSGAKPPETEFGMALCVIADRMTRIKDHAGQFRIPSGILSY